MTSKRKVRANRENARASSGPRTKAGKLRSARNAFRHGLSISTFADSALVTALDPFACHIAGGDPSPALQELSRLIVVAQFDLVRVRQARHQLISEAMNAPDTDDQEITEPAKPKAKTPTTPKPFADLGRRLAALDRYERRTLSRRKFAIRNFDAIRSSKIHANARKSL